MPSLGERKLVALEGLGLADKVVSVINLVTLFLGILTSS